MVDDVVEDGTTGAVGEPTDDPITEPLTRRARARAATIDEIKQTALTLMRQQSTTDVRFADIARSMGLTAPALYRYFADRDELLTAMIVDAFEDLAAALAAAVVAVPPGDPGRRLMATAQAYRLWARQDQQRFALIFGLPVPGYVAPVEGPTALAAKRAMANLEGVVVAAMEAGMAGPPIVPEAGAALARHLGEERHRCPAIPAATYQAMLLCWAGLHGFACLEAYGHLEWLSDDGRDALFTAQVRLSAASMGLSDPAPGTVG